MKKALTLFLALALCLSVMAISVFADGITYRNEQMGFELTLPALWEGRYGVIEGESFYSWPDEWYFVTFYDIKLKEYSEKTDYPDTGSIVSIVILPRSEYPWFDIDDSYDIPGFRGIIREDESHVYFCLTRSDAPGFPIDDAKSREVTNEYRAMSSDIADVLKSFRIISDNIITDTKDVRAPHFFATALREFFTDVPLNSAAILYDLDNDGEDEVVAVKGSQEPGYMPEINEIAVFDIENGQNVSANYVFEDKINRIYITDTDYIATDYDAGGYTPSYYQYKDGSIIRKTMFDGEFGDIDGIVQCIDLEIGKPLSEEKLMQYEGTPTYEDVAYNSFGTTYYDKVLIRNYITVYSMGVMFKEKPLIDQTEEIYVMAGAQGIIANPTSSSVLVNGKEVAFDAYNINNNNYFKLRDIAYVLNGTGKQFAVDWDEAANAISLTSGQGYAAVGGEMTGKGDGVKTAEPTSSKILINGAEVSLTTYNIGGNNYFKLRDIGAVFTFGVDWDGVNNAIVIDTSKGYTEE